MEVIYEDNHLIIVNKAAGEIVQGDKTGDETLADKVKAYLKQKYNKPGNVFLGITHRLDRPTTGIVIFAKTSKALVRMNKLFSQGKVHKTYLALVCCPPKLKEAKLIHYLTRNEKQNKSYAHLSPVPQSKEAILQYKIQTTGKKYTLLRIHLLTGRHHQIRCQLSAIGSVIKGDLKYGAPRSNVDGGICLHSYQVSFIHPVTQTLLELKATPPLVEPWLSLYSVNKKEN